MRARFLVSRLELLARLPIARSALANAETPSPRRCSEGAEQSAAADQCQHHLLVRIHLAGIYCFSGS